MEKGAGNSFQKLWHVIESLPEANWTTFVVGASALALLFLLPRLSRRIPAGLVVLFLYILLSSVLDLFGRFGVEVVGELPQGLPALAIPDVPASAVLDMVLPALGIVLVAYSQGIGVAREFADKHGYEVDANQELRAYGVTNLASGFLGGMIAAGTMGSSAVKEGAGARTQVSNLVAWVAVIISLVFLAPIFKNSARGGARGAHHPCLVAHHRGPQVEADTTRVSHRVRCLVGSPCSVSSSSTSFRG